ncbi:hypothetical protein PoB_004299100 [Plakobranchus ocellatus]|uniref:Uncharacterized protein n=1 Tax=Plakobranchus ocellatus TaxID=259542 RepID=A0AAV4BCC8_9GAST|nr:hypothetical protein PoB_004299100 [Plakobranchus ocellatus]
MEEKEVSVKNLPPQRVWKCGSVSREEKEIKMEGINRREADPAQSRKLSYTIVNGESNQTPEIIADIAFGRKLADVTGRRNKTTSTVEEPRKEPNNETCKTVTRKGFNSQMAIINPNRTEERAG